MYVNMLMYAGLSKKVRCVYEECALDPTQLY